MLVVFNNAVNTNNHRMSTVPSLPNDSVQTLFFFNEATGHMHAKDYAIIRLGAAV